jgi:hypothetical protein
MGRFVKIFPQEEQLISWFLKELAGSVFHILGPEPQEAQRTCPPTSF